MNALSKAIEGIWSLKISRKSSDCAQSILACIFNILPNQNCKHKWLSEVSRPLDLWVSVSVSSQSRISTVSV